MNTLNPTLTVKSSSIPGFSGYSHSLGAVPLSGIFGGLIASAIGGKEIEGVLTLEVSGSQATEQLQITTDIPFIGGILKPFTAKQAVPTEIASLLGELAPGGETAQVTITL